RCGGVHEPAEQEPTFLLLGAELDRSAPPWPELDGDEAVVPGDATGFNEPLESQTGGAAGHRREIREEHGRHLSPLVACGGAEACAALKGEGAVEDVADLGAVLEGLHEAELRAPMREAMGDVLQPVRLEVPRA